MRFVAQHGQWGLLESLGTALCRLTLLTPAAGEGRAAADATDVRIRKPKALKGVATPVVQLTRSKEWAAHDAPFGDELVVPVSASARPLCHVRSDTRQSLQRGQSMGCELRTGRRRRSRRADASP